MDKKEISLSDKKDVFESYEKGKQYLYWEKDIREAIQKILERIEKMEKTDATNEQKCSLQSVIEIIKSEMGGKLMDD